MKILLSFFLFFNLCCYAEVDSASIQLRSYVNNIESFNRHLPQEKVYLHFDNTAYFLGDTLRFKAYVAEATKLNFTNISKVLYVELLTPEGNVLTTRKLKIENGQCHGNFIFSHKYNYSGFYEVRAYTRYMLNWDDSYIFSRVFPIYEKSEKDGNYKDLTIKGYSHRQKPDLVRQPEILPKDIDITFFPEGGNLVKGLSSNIAFKAIDEKGQSIDIEGILYNSSNEPIDTIKTSHLGMGMFQYIPDEGKAYIEVSHKKKKRRFDLPDVLSDGYVMTLNNYNKDSLYVHVHASLQGIGTSLGLSIMCRGNISIFKYLEVVDRSISLQLPKAEMQAGVNQITLFDIEGKVISERMFFVPPPNTSSIALLSPLKQYKPFERISLAFQCSDSSGFSLSVRDYAGEVADWDRNIQTDLLLSSDIKGYIEKPQSYFTNNDSKSKSNLDLLMLVQGWRRYVWQQMSTLSIKRQKHEVEKGIVLKGQIRSNISEYIEKDSVDLIMNFSVKGQIYKTKIDFDKEGKFSLQLDDFQGNAPTLIYIKNKIQIDSTKNEITHNFYKILLDRVFTPIPKPYIFTDTQIRFSKQTIDSEKKITEKKMDLTQVQVLPEVTIGGRYKIESRSVNNVEKEKSDLLDQGFSHPETVYDYLLWKGIPIEEKSLDETEKRNKNEVLYGKNGRAYVYTAYGENVLFLYAGIGKWKNIKSLYSIPNLSLDEVKLIKVFDNSYAYKKIMNKKSGPVRGSKVTIVIEPYKKDDVLNIQGQTNVRSTKIEGYSIMREFYSPDYGKYPPIPGDVDYRRTLYWNPNVSTDKNGKAVVSFYNNSSCENLIISAEGLTEGGIPIVYQKN